jgi:putative endonuclease
MIKRGILNRLLGNRGERAAAKYLRKCGYRILARQSRSRIGEIDLIALDVDGDAIVFVEVKTRSSHAAGHPSEAVTRSKQQQLTRAALAWLKRRRLLNQRGRFDVIAITWTDSGPPQIEHYRNAFEPSGRGQMFA